MPDEKNFRAQADEAIAQRVAEILASRSAGPRVFGTSLGQPARVVGHMRLRCRACGTVRSANFEGGAGGCGGHSHLSHDFHGIDTVVSEVEKLEPHHAIHIEGTVCYPAEA